MTSYRVTISNHRFGAIYFVSAATENAAKWTVLLHHNARLNEEEGEPYTWAKAQEEDDKDYPTEPRFFDSGSE